MIVNKKITVLSIALIALFSLALSASADTSNGKLLERDRAVTSSGDDVDLDEVDDLDESLNDIDETLSDLEKKLDDVDDVEDVDDSNGATNTNTVRTRSEEHRGDIADIVEKLERVARDADEVGDDIDEVVKEQRELEKKAVKALDEVEKRDGLRTFFFGADYKNLGELRSTLVTTENHIERLMRAASSTTDVAVRTELEAQVQALRDTASTTEVFIRDNEGKFSLFGWFVRVFQK
jgi:DNA repair exonuclease SbcCD ATPase subunit